MSRSRDTKRWKQSRHCRETAYRIGHRGYISRTFSWISEVKCINVARLLSMCAPMYMVSRTVVPNIFVFEHVRRPNWQASIAAHQMMNAWQVLVAKLKQTWLHIVTNSSRSITCDRPQHSGVLKGRSIDHHGVHARVGTGNGCANDMPNIMQSIYGDAENARNENARHENAAPNCTDGKCETW